MLRHIIKPSQVWIRPLLVRHNHYEKQHVKDPTNKTTSTNISWSTEDTDTTTMHRDKHKIDYPFKNEDGSISYYGFKYYPRYPDQEDPAIEPSPLFMVTRVKTMKGKPWWQKNVLDELGIGEDAKAKSDVAIVKNIPEVNEKLYIVKDMIKITPIKLPEHLPEHADPTQCFLTEDGEFLYNPNEVVDPDKLKPHPEYYTLRWEKDFVNQEIRKSWSSAYNLKLA